MAEKASGEWLCFLDADDELAPGYVSVMQRAIRQERRRSAGDLPLLLTPVVQDVIRGRFRSTMFRHEVNLMQANWLVIGTLIEREFFDRLGGFRLWPHGLEDWDLWSRAWKAGCKIIRVRTAVYIAHHNEHSPHHALMRRRDEHIYWHQKVGHANWPEHFAALTPEEDERKRLLRNGRVHGALRMLNVPEPTPRKRGRRIRAR